MAGREAMTVQVTNHAISRAIERCGFANNDEAEAMLRSAAIEQAADFGAPFVRLGTGQRVVLCGRRVVTVLPAHTWPGCLDRSRDHLHGRRG